MGGVHPGRQQLSSPSAVGGAAVTTSTVMSDNTLEVFLIREALPSLGAMEDLHV